MAVDITNTGAVAAYKRQAIGIHTSNSIIEKSVSFRDMISRCFFGFIIYL